MRNVVRGGPIRNHTRGGEMSVSAVRYACDAS